jgi:hypothetical protein
MASHPRTRGREEERRLSIRTLVIASFASLTAALVTSRIWTAGTPITAAVTPVIVALVSEMLHRPAEKVVRRFTTDSTAVEPEPEPGGAPHPPEPQVPRTREPAQPWRESVPGATPTGTGTGPVRVYGRPTGRRRRIALGAVVVTGLLAFAIAAAALTIPELIAGQSIGKSGSKSTLFGGHRHKAKQRPQSTTPTQTQTQQQTTPQKTTTEKTTPQQQKTTPQQTTPQRTAPSQPPPGSPSSP